MRRNRNTRQVFFPTVMTFWVFYRFVLMNWFISVKFRSNFLEISGLIPSKNLMQHSRILSNQSSRMAPRECQIGEYFLLNGKMFWSCFVSRTMYIHGINIKHFIVLFIFHHLFVCIRSNRNVSVIRRASLSGKTQWM